MKNLFKNILCFIGYHNGHLVEREKDPFLGQLEGHTGTELCNHCGKHRRILGGYNEYAHVLEWVDSEKAYGVKFEDLTIDIK